MANAVEHVKRAAESAHAQAAHQLERIQAELKFAGQLCDLHPDQAEAWRPLIEQAATLVADSAKTGGVADVASAVTRAEEILAPLGGAAKGYTIYCAGHAHIDMNWMWSWPETVAVTNDTFSTVVRLMDEFPTFCFSQSQASVYAILEQHHPELLAKIAERVREGRWEVTASHWVEGDKNLAGGESLCRHLLYTRRYMQKLFDLSPEDVPIDWAPDTFGHAATVPSYLVRGGVKYVYLHRPGGHGPVRPRAFRWRAPDGSEVLVRNDMESGYNGQITPNMVDLLVNFVNEIGLPFTLFMYGVGDHGGGPTRRDILRGLDMQTWPIFPVIEFAPVSRFFERLATEGGALPLLDCELNFEFTGCYTTQTLIKKANRFGENRLVDAEAASALAWCACRNGYNAAALEQGWRDTLFSHFHDILPGSGVHDTRTYTHGLYQQTMATTSMEETKALRLLASRIDTSHLTGPADADVPPSRMTTAMGSGVGFSTVDGGLSHAEQSAGGGERPLVVFNPLAFDRSEIIEATVWDGIQGWRTNELRNIPFAVTGPDGQAVAAQTVDTGSYWGHDYVRLAFPAKTAGLGYALYTVREQKAEPADGPRAHQLGRQHHCPYARHEREQEGVENGLVRLDIDMKTGGVRSLFDKRSNVNLVTPDHSAPILEYAVERPHGMTSWTVDHTGPARELQVTAIRRGLPGPYKATVDVSFRVSASDFTLTYELRAGDPNVYLHIKGTWMERGTRETGIPALAFVLPLNLREARARYEIPFGAVDRDLNRGQEVPALRWAQVTGASGGRQAGCVLLNDSKHGHSLNASTLRLTLIRSSYDPDPLPEIGSHEIHLAIHPFADDMPVADAIRLGQAHNHALRVMGTDVHEGPLGAAARLVTVSPDTLVLSGLKKAEDEDALVVRLFNPTDAATTAKIALDQDVMGEVTDAFEVDMMERVLGESTVLTEDETVCVDVPARGIVSVMVKAEHA